MAKSNIEVKAVKTDAVYVLKEGNDFSCIEHLIGDGLGQLKWENKSMPPNHPIGYDFRPHNNSIKEEEKEEDIPKPTRKKAEKEIIHYMDGCSESISLQANPIGTNQRLDKPTRKKAGKEITQKLPSDQSKITDHLTPNPKNQNTPQIDVSKLSTKEIKQYLQTNLDEYILQSRVNPTITKEVKNRTFVNGLAGCGKSYTTIVDALKNFEPNQILVVAPWNSQVREALKKNSGINACTFHSLMGFDHNGNKTLGCHSMEGIKCVIFEEIMLLTRRNLVDVYKFMQNKKLYILANGDSHQLESIGDDVSTDEKTGYITKMFKWTMTLTQNHRLETDEDKLKMIEFFNDLFHSDLGVYKTILKHFPKKILKSLEDLKELGINKAITHRDTSSNSVNKYLDSLIDKKKIEKADKLKTLDNGITYHYNQELICKTTINRVVKNSPKTKDSPKIKSNKIKMRPNYRYTIVGQTNKHFTLQDVQDKELRVDIPHDMIVEHFKLSHANTCHSEQGACIDEKFVICDMKIITDIRWAYCAVSRCVRLSDVYFLDFNLKDLNLIEFFNGKICGYKKQDRKRDKNFVPCNNYITIDWCIELYKKENNRICRKCQQYMGVEKHSKNQCTVDREDNDLHHIKSNCHLCCLQCNRANQKNTD